MIVVIICVALSSAMAGGGFGYAVIMGAIVAVGIGVSVEAIIEFDSRSLIAQRDAELRQIVDDAKCSLPDPNDRQPPPTRIPGPGQSLHR